MQYFRMSHRATEARRKRWQAAHRDFLYLLCASVALWLIIALLISPPPVRAQSGIASDRIELHQALLDLTNSWTVLCVAAHPDDEDGATLTVLRRKYGAHTVTLFSTYGEGGQNAIGPELYEELGAIRARETLRAAEIQGSEAHFLALRDFGFSKSAGEAFRIWGHEEALRRMVLQIRSLRPDVIITNHDTTSGHGHHQATGRLVEEAFDAAADPKRFPEQLGTADVVGVWQPQRLFVRVNYESGTGSKALEDEATRAGKIVTVNPNEPDPVRGTSYAEQALRALQQHASQGPWPNAIPKDGAPLIRYRLAREAKDAAPLPANASTVLEGLQLPEHLKRKLASPTINGRSLLEFTEQRERVFKAIASTRARIIPFDDAVKANKDRRNSLRHNRTDDALLAASGISMSLIPQEAALIPNTSASFTLKFSNQGTKGTSIESVTFVGFNRDLQYSKKSVRLMPQTTVTQKFETLIPKESAVNLPRAMHLYDGRLFGETFEAIVRLKIDGVTVWQLVTAQVDIAPAVEIASIQPSPYVFTPANLNQPLTFRVRLVNHQSKPFKGDFGIASPAEHINEVGADIELGANETREFTLRTNVIPVDTPDERRTPRADFGSIIFSVHPPESADIITERETRVIYSDAHVAPNLRVGYVRSFDDTLRNALDALGVESKELTVEDVRAGDLQKYDTIIIDNRGYQAHPELVAANSRLLDYVQRGGTLIVFYHKASEWNPDPQKSRPQLAPLSIILGSERVTDENAPVTFNDAQHPLLNIPNKISADDFKGWVQERGLYYPKTWDAKYRAPLSMSDAGEAPLSGGLLTLEHGRGQYIYTSMVWYRQLRAGVPGAYRVFANMISYK